MYKIEEITNKILQGDVLEELKKIPDESVDCIVTSPPYFGLRNYSVDKQIGLENHPQEYINKIVEVVCECMRILKSSGVMFLNIGDSYGRHRDAKSTQLFSGTEEKISGLTQRNAGKDGWFRNKQKLLIPHRIAIAIQDKGFIIRDDIVWVKKLNIFPEKISVGSTMPFPVKDKLLPATEYIFQIVKSDKYFFDLEGVKTEIKNSTIERAKTNFYYLHK